ncbi:MAG: MFS transporter [bacterium]|nr:MFS transporter [bacterium]
MGQEAESKTDIKQLGLLAAIFSLGYVFWVVGAMEMVERLAYYGVRAVAGLYATAPASEGGLGVTAAQFGIILMIWSGFQGFIPIFVGGLADRYGYKLMIGISTVVKMTAYLIMGFLPTFYGFMAGAVCLATGTAIFKPGIQGTLAKTTKPENSSMAWGIYYQTVNIGGFIGPVLAGFLRKMEWSHVFFACAAIIACNFLLLITYKEPGLEERLARAKEREAKQEKQGNIILDTLKELKRPHLCVFLVIFTGFYFMFNCLFDVLPLHIRDWVDSTDVVASVSNILNVENPVVGFIMILDSTKTYIQPEGMLNLNCGMIMFTCFFFAWVSSKMRILRSIALGTALSSLSMCLIGISHMGWFCLLSIAVFSVGEMLSSPKFSEFVGTHLASSDKKGMYLGLGQMSFAVGSTLEGLVAPRLYDTLGSKDTFSRQMIAELNLLDPQQIAAIKPGEAFNQLILLSGRSAQDLTQFMYHHHNVASMWYIMAAIGFTTAVLILVYSAWWSRTGHSAAVAKTPQVSEAPQAGEEHGEASAVDCAVKDEAEEIADVSKDNAPNDSKDKD